MTAEEAKEYGYADAIVARQEEAIAYLGWEDAEIFNAEPDFS